MQLHIENRKKIGGWKRGYGRGGMGGKYWYMIYMDICVYTHIYVCMFIYMCMCMYVGTKVGRYVGMHNMYEYIHAHPQVYIYI